MKRDQIPPGFQVLSAVHVTNNGTPTSEAHTLAHSLQRRGRQHVASITVHLEDVCVVLVVVITAIPPHLASTWRRNFSPLMRVIWLRILLGSQKEDMEQEAEEEAGASSL